MFNSTLPHSSLEGYLKYVIYIGYYFAIVPIFRKRKRNVLRVVLLIAALCSIESFYALLQSKTVIAGATWQDYSYINPEDAISRIYGSLKPATKYPANKFGLYGFKLPYILEIASSGLI